MTHVKITLGALFLSTAFFAACDSGGAEYVKSMEGFAEKSCACKDVECTGKVATEQAEWLTANAEKAAKLDAKDAEKITAASTKMAGCATKIATDAATAAVPK